MSILSRLSCEWAIRCFGIEHVSNKAERALRTLEEAVELAQALGVPKETAALCVETVYGRPVGEPMQEIGGVLLTTNILCASLGNLEPDDMLEMEFARVLAKPTKHFTDRNAEKAHIGLKVQADPPAGGSGVPPKILRA